MYKTVATTLTLVLAACSVGSVNGDNVPTDAAADPRAGTFDQMVLPLVNAKTCNEAGCHGGAQNPKMTSFALLTEVPANAAKYLKVPAAENILITKDALSPGTHQGRAYLDAADKAAISTWLATGP